MKDYEKLRRKWKSILWILGALVLLLLIISWYKVVVYDTNEIIVTNDTSDSKVVVEMGSDKETHDSWDTGLPVSDGEEEKEILTGTTCSCAIVNNNKFQIKNWTLRINIVQDCYLNGFWCGTFEVHQFRNGAELVEEIGLPGQDIIALPLDINRYSDNLMLHLLPGDYLVYHPSEDTKEDVVFAEKSVGIGFIFYYQDYMDLSHYELTYNNNLRMKDDILFKLSLVCVVVWVGILIIYLYLSSTIKKIRVEMKNQIKNVSIMADLYLEVYMIDVEKDSSYLIKGNENDLICNIIGDHTQEALGQIIDEHCKEMYRADLKDFLELKTIHDRLDGVSSISYEFVDNRIGWCSIRVFGTVESNKVVLAIQDINDEKRHQKIVEERISAAEFSQSVNGNFIGTVSFAIKDIIARISDDSKNLYGTLEDDEQRGIADRIQTNIEHLNLVQNMLFDMYAIEGHKFQLDIKPYNPYEMVDELCHILLPFSMMGKYEFKVEVDKDIPTSLLGDVVRLKQMLVVLLFSSLIITQEGFVKFSVFGKNNGDHEELIFSIRDTAHGFDVDQIKEMQAFIGGSRIESFDNASLVYLKIINNILGYMGSELKFASVFGEGSEFYFSLKNEIVKE